jgi:hypothetical protein
MEIKINFNLDEQLYYCSLEQCSRLNLLGFSEECFFHYDLYKSSKVIIPNNDMKPLNYNGWHATENENDYRQGPTTGSSAPSLLMAADWFKKHGLIISTNFDTKVSSYKVDLIQNSNVIKSAYCQSLPEALSLGIDMALLQQEKANRRWNVHHCQEAKCKCLKTASSCRHTFDIEMSSSCSFTLKNGVKIGATIGLISEISNGECPFQEKDWKSFDELKSALEKKRKDEEKNKKSITD